LAIREAPVLSANLEVIGNPEGSVVAFASKNVGIDTYDIADGMSGKGWHLNALQDPPAIHIAFTRPTAVAVDRLQTELTEVVNTELAKAEERRRQGKSFARQRGDTAALYGIAGSLPDKSIVNRLAEGFLDALYKS
jgi:sphinganine-1-phosphate aldolase